MLKIQIFPTCGGMVRDVLDAPKNYPLSSRICDYRYKKNEDSVTSFNVVILESLTPVVPKKFPKRKKKEKMSKCHCASCVFSRRGFPFKEK